MKESITSQEKMTDGQVAKVKELIEAALRKSGLGGDGIQRVIEKGGELKNKLIPIFQKLSELPYASEEMKSIYGYPEGWKLKDILEQLIILQKIKEFKALNARHVIRVAEHPLDVPEGADGLVVIPKPSKIANSYNEAVILMTELMEENRKDWFNYRRGQLGPEYLRLTEKTKQAIIRLEKETPGDYLVIPIQTGLCYSGRSIRRTRVMFIDGEFGLGPYEVGIILLTHPERLQKSEHLGINCAGCEYSPVADSKFSDGLYLDWHNGELRFDNYWVGYVFRNFGSASAFLG